MSLYLDLLKNTFQSSESHAMFASKVLMSNQEQKLKTIELFA